MAKKDKPPKSDEVQSAEGVQYASMAEALLDYDQFVQAQAQNLWQYDDLPFDLNMEEQLFVRSYVIDRNEVSALRRLGHIGEQSTLRNRAKRYLAKAEVQAAVEHLGKKMMEMLDITAEKVQRQIAAVAFFDPRQVMEFDQYNVRMLHSRFWTSEQVAAVKKIKMGPNGVELELYDRLRASEMLAKQLGVQPEDNDAAEQARLGAEQAIEKIFTVFERMSDPDPVPPAIEADVKTKH